MATPRNLEDIRNELRGAAQACYAKGDALEEINPMVFIYHRNGHREIVEGDPERALQAALKMHPTPLTFVGLVMELWYVKRKTLLIPGERPSTQPDRCEGVLALAIDASHQLVSFADITRSMGPARLGAWHPLPKSKLGIRLQQLAFRSGDE